MGTTPRRISAPINKQLDIYQQPLEHVGKAIIARVCDQVQVPVGGS
jgi:hypothetical protein